MPDEFPKGPPDEISLAFFGERGLERLRSGSATQRAAVRALDELGIVPELGQLEATLAGTVPLDLVVPGSDLDILLYAPDLDAVAARVRERYGQLAGYRDHTRVIGARPAFVAVFTSGDWPVEIFACDQPVIGQDGFLHLIAEWRLLSMATDEFRAQVLALKCGGTKTEPAFCEALGVRAEPYVFLRSLARCPDQELRRLIADC